ncbi:MAG: acVLRF1 family peptidyl-tRNA hydrolase [Propionicimonas sp.]|uniref:acVLRF1 family peptidyl-tRNA hydrolase n=1 Tax=Propionicimonas sp. TaxID=1955623 RepID=UPI003D141E9A
MGAPQGWRTVGVAPERLAGWLDGFSLRHGAPAVENAGDAVVLRSPDGARARIRTPWPTAESPDPLAALVESATRPRVVGVLIARREAHAVGVFAGTTLQDGRHGSHYVQGRTKAGGWSQQRYARRRANQSTRSFDAAADDAVAVLLPAADRLEALATGGDRSAVHAVLGHPALGALTGLPRLGVFSVPNPNAGVLASFAEVFRRVPIDLNELA